MNLIYLFIILIMILLASSVVFAYSSQYYGKTYVYFNIPNITAFNVTIPNNSVYTSSASGQATADEEFNSSTPSDKNVTVRIRTSTYRQNSTVIGDVNNITNYNITNIGNTNTNITLCINASLPSTIVLWGTTTADPYKTPGTIPVCSSGSWIANSSLPTGNWTQVWIWANFTGATLDSTVRMLYLNSTPSGA
jgi:hypothetical protein